jgi:hypothetical protein
MFTVELCRHTYHVRKMFSPKTNYGYLTTTIKPKNTHFKNSGCHLMGSFWARP